MGGADARPRARWLLALASAGAAAWIGARFLPGILAPREPAGGVTAVELGEDVEELFRERAEGSERRREERGPPRPPRRIGRERLGEDVALKLFPVIETEKFVFDPVRGFARTPDSTIWVPWAEHEDGGWWNRTNSLGMREDGNPSEPTPEWRIVVTGDSHTEGAVANDESFANVLERRLVDLGHDAEVWNAGCGIYSFYEYLGTLEVMLALEPDVFVVTVYGGNDFSGAMPLQRYFHRRPAPQRTWPRIKPYSESGGRTPPDVFHQDLEQAIYFRLNPEDEEVSLCTAVDVCFEMAAICEREDIELVFVYLPPPSSAQPLLFADLYADAMRAFELSIDEVARSDRLADEWLRIFDAAGLRCLDLRPAFRAASEPLYWFRDQHIDVEGHALVARELEPVVRALVE